MLNTDELVRAAQSLAPHSKGRTSQSCLNLIVYRDGRPSGLSISFTRLEMAASFFVLVVLFGFAGFLVGRALPPGMVLASVGGILREAEELRSYEQELRLRASALEAVLSEAGELELTEGVDERSGKAPKKSRMRRAVGGGMGGGDAFSAPLLTLRGNKREVSAVERTPRNLPELLELNLDRLRSFPIGSPVRGDVTSDFGRRISPFSGKWQFHPGVDIAVDSASSIQAVADGVVVLAGYKGAYGRVVIISHGNGYETLYGHLQKVTVKPGERVCRGEKIGLVGSSGRTTGPHVHYEVRYKGKVRDPEKFLQLPGLLKLAS